MLVGTFVHIAERSIGLNHFWKNTSVWHIRRRTAENVRFVRVRSFKRENFLVNISRWNISNRQSQKNITKLVIDPSQIHRKPEVQKLKYISFEQTMSNTDFCLGDVHT
jgi:hypothetical protein